MPGGILKHFVKSDWEFVVLENSVEIIGFTPILKPHALEEMFPEPWDSTFDAAEQIEL